MSRLSDLADILIETRVATGDQWASAVRAAGGDLDRILAALTAAPPHWWDRKPPAPPGLTDYQRDAILSRYQDDELDLLPRDLALNQFLLLDMLGQGGQGAVFRSRQLSPPRFAAIKTLVRDSEVSRRRFEQEARAMMKVQHPALARFYLYERVRNADGKPTDVYLIAMELVPGIDLHRLVWQDGPVPWPFAVRWLIDLLGGLAVLHRSGFIHRDVKPQNVMIVGPTPGAGVSPAATAAKLLDLGAARRVGGEEIVGSKVFVGTMEFAAPEQWTGELVPASDLYALAGTLYHALSGRSPFQKDRRDGDLYRESHENEEPPDLRELDSDIPDGLNRLYHQMMAKDPTARGNADELIVAFRRLLPVEATSPVPAAKPRPAPATSSPPSRDRHSPTHQPHSSNPLAWPVEAILGLLERAFVPRHQRPTAGHEASVSERVASLLRRPLVLIVILVIVSLLLSWAL